MSGNAEFGDAGWCALVDFIALLCRLRTPVAVAYIVSLPLTDLAWPHIGGPSGGEKFGLNW